MGITAAELAATSSKNSSSSLFFLLLIALVFVGFYFLMIKPQRRRQQQAMQQQNTVSPGARVRTTAGMYATVIAVDGDDVVLEVAPGVEVRYMRRAIMEVISPGDEPLVEEDAVDSEYSDEHDESGEATRDEASFDEQGRDEELDDRASANGTKAKSETDTF
ncbi:MAG TPA: preprotein translocase subunit YajC [Streptosporangiaceae bacterium]|nr:preprotein translocase subunit YajC [Streptosporangiaceae bacterium]